MSYRADEDARAARADALIREIAALERARAERADLARRLDAARAELDGLQADPAPPAPARAPGALAHVAVFVTAALASAAGYALLT